MKQTICRDAGINLIDSINTTLIEITYTFKTNWTWKMATIKRERVIRFIEYMQMIVFCSYTNKYIRKHIVIHRNGNTLTFRFVFPLRNQLFLLNIVPIIA